MPTISLPHVISDFLRDGIAKADCEWVLTERNQWFLENSNTGVWVVRIRMNWDGLVELTHARKDQPPRYAIVADMDFAARVVEDVGVAVEALRFCPANFSTRQPRQDS